MSGSQNLASVPKLMDLLSDPARISAVPREAIAELRGQIATIDSLLLSRLLTGEQPELIMDGDRLLKVDEAALKLGLPKDALYRNEFPFVVRIGGRRLYSKRGIEKFIRSRMGM